MRLYDRYVSEQLYDSTFDVLYPILKENEIYKRLFFHFSFPKFQFRDEDSGLILVSEEILAMIEYKEDQLANNNYKGSTLLENYKRDVAPNLEWSGYSAKDGKARAILNTGFSPEYQALLDAEREGFFKGNKKYFLSGKAYNRANRELQRTLQREDAFKLMKVTENPDATFVGNYLNNLPSRAFTEIVQKNLEAAREVARNIVFKPKRKISEANRLDIEARLRETNLDILTEIEAQAQPLYKPSENTVRLFTITAHMGNLKSEVREALTQGWLELDLKSSQLVITATLWGVTEVIEFLNQGGNIWREMFTHYGIPLDEDVKKAFKTALYAIIFGAETSDVQRHLTKALKALGIKQSGSLFIQHRLIQAMLKGRDKEIDRINTLGGAYTVYNEWLSVVDSDVSTDNAHTVKNILAQQAHAVELKVISTLFYLAAGNDDFTITLYQFDGVSILFKDKSKQKAYVERMKKEVQSIGHSLGMNIELIEK
jgi:hypothetical protein